jgi:hypothetical protein
MVTRTCDFYCKMSYFRHGDWLLFSRGGATVLKWSIVELSDQQPIPATIGQSVRMLPMREPIADLEG